MNIMDLEFINGQMDENMKDNLKKDLWMVKANLRGQMVSFIKEGI